MVRLTFIFRVEDALPLAAMMEEAATDPALREAKNNAKSLMQKVTRSAEPRCSIESGGLTFHYMVENEICYMVVCDKSYQRSLAFEFLNELSREFYVQHGAVVPSAVRPYAFIKFDTYIQRLQRKYMDSRNTAGLQKLNEELHDVTRIMTKNMEDLLHCGESLEKMSTMSDSLRESSLKYRKDAKRLRHEELLRKYGPLVALLIFFVLILWYKLF